MTPFDLLKFNLPIATTIASFIGITWYVGIELNIRLLWSFRKRKGLYFWSCLMSCWGSMLCQLFNGVLLDFGVVSNPWVTVPPIYLSWAIMVLGQSLVLYSQLHLLMDNYIHLRWVLGMIIATALCVMLPTVIYGIIRLFRPNLILDRLQVVTFFIQETILSGLYVHQTRKYLDSSAILGHHNKSSNSVMRHLLWINVLMILLNIAIVVLSFIGLNYFIQATLKPAVYCIKLRLEFSILNSLVETVTNDHSIPSAIRVTSETPCFSTPPWEPHAEWTPRRPSSARIESFSSRPMDAMEQVLDIEGKLRLNRRLSA